MVPRTDFGKKKRLQSEEGNLNDRGFTPPNPSSKQFVHIFDSIHRIFDPHIYHASALCLCVGLICLSQDIGGGSGVDIGVDVGGNLQGGKVTVRTLSLLQRVLIPDLGKNYMRHTPRTKPRTQEGSSHAVGVTCKAMSQDDRGSRGAGQANCGMRVGGDYAVAIAIVVKGGLGGVDWIGVSRRRRRGRNTQGRSRCTAETQR